MLGDYAMEMYDISQNICCQIATLRQQITNSYIAIFVYVMYWFHDHFLSTRINIRERQKNHEIAYFYTNH